MSEPLDKVVIVLLVLCPVAVTSCSERLCFQGYLTYTIYVLLGSGLLFPWNAFITAADYFESEFPVSSTLGCSTSLLAGLVQSAEPCCTQGRHTDRLITVCYLPITLVMLLVMIHYNHCTNIALRISGGMAGFCLSMIAVPLVSMSSYYAQGTCSACASFFFPSADTHPVPCHSLMLIVQKHMVAAVGHIALILTLLPSVCRRVHCMSTAVSVIMSGGALCKWLPAARCCDSSASST